MKAVGVWRTRPLKSVTFS